MSKHLPVLMAMFPGEMMLDVDQIASLTKYSKGHIYNLASKDQLPFMPARSLGDRILVSIVEMADYLDSNLLSKGTAKEVVPPVEEKRKVGRPRGSTKARLEIHSFQSALRTAIYKFEINSILTDLQSAADSLVLSDDATLTCAEKFEAAKSSMLHSVGVAQSQFSEVELSLEIPLAAKTNAELGITRSKL